MLFVLFSSTQKFIQIENPQPNRSCKIERRQVSSILDAHTFRGSNDDLGHYFKGSKARSSTKTIKVRPCKVRLFFLLSESINQKFGIKDLWNRILSSLRTDSNETIGVQKGRKNRWNGEYCRVAVERKQMQQARCEKE